jgi:hypothetical protein
MYFIYLVLVDFVCYGFQNLDCDANQGSPNGFWRALGGIHRSFKVKESLEQVRAFIGRA